MMTRRGFTLIEMLMSFSLITLLLTSLFFAYHRMTLARYEAASLYRPLLEEHIVHTSLDKIFSHVFLDPSKEKSCFYSSIEPNGTMSLTFTLDNDIHPNPHLCQIILAKLYVEHESLWLTLWPLPKESASLSWESGEHLLLLNDIKSLSYQFLFPLTLEAEPPMPATWHEQWPRDAHRKPALIRMIVKGAHEYHWTFDLKLPITYPTDIT